MKLSSSWNRNESSYIQAYACKSCDKAFTDKDWIFEIKWDGFRAISYIDEGFNVKSRNGKELKHNFPELSELTKLSKNIVVDGEIIVMR